MRKYIKGHYQQKAKTGQMSCNIQDCGVIMYAKDLCYRHYMKLKRTGIFGDSKCKHVMNKKKSIEEN